MSRIVIVMPAYYAEKTLRATHAALPRVYEKIILCDDRSLDKTFEISKELGIDSIQHEKNVGYGGNQKTLYDVAKKMGADIIIMVHPDNQYDTRCLPQMIKLIENGATDMVLGSRIESALENGMPIWKYAGNYFLTLMQNLFFRTAMSEFHSGLRAYRAEIFSKMPYHLFSDDFVFDSEVIAYLIANRYKISEVKTNCYYTSDASSTSFSQSVKYGLATLGVIFKYLKGYYSRLGKSE